MRDSKGREGKFYGSTKAKRYEIEPPYTLAATCALWVRVISRIPFNKVNDKNDVQEVKLGTYEVNSRLRAAKQRDYEVPSRGCNFCFIFWRMESDSTPSP